MPSAATLPPAGSGPAGTASRDEDSLWFDDSAEEVMRLYERDEQQQAAGIMLANSYSAARS